MAASKVVGRKKEALRKLSSVTYSTTCWLEQRALASGGSSDGAPSMSLFKCHFTSIFYSVLHSLEDEGQLDPNNSTHLFCCHYVFLPRLQHSLNVFCDGWDNHPLRTEQNMTPNQMWNCKIPFMILMMLR
ncbi:unnamed protein product [Merluccius merluccius]